MFQSNSRITVEAIIIVNVCLITLFWETAVANNPRCCSRPDIELIVDCSDGSARLQWKPDEVPIFGFRVRYGCNSNASCFGGNQRSFKNNELIENGDMYETTITNSNFGNATCWFWVKNLDRINDNFGCSTAVECYAVSANNESVMSSSATTSSPSMLSTSSISVSSPSSTTSIIPSSSPPLPATTTTSAISFSSIILPSQLSSSTTTTIATTVTKMTSNSIMTTMSMISVLPSSSTKAPFQNISPDRYTIPLYIVLCCIIIFILLLLTTCLFVYWRKRKIKQFENLGQVDIDVCCDYPGELSKESDSETETVGNGHGIGDDISITDDDNYMLRKILRPDDISLDLSIFADDKADDGSVTNLNHYGMEDGSTDCSHYCGSGGHSLQSSTNSNHRRSSSCSSVC